MKKIKSIVSAVLIGSMLFAMAGCAKVKEYDKGEVKDILKDDLDVNKNSIYTSDRGDYEYLTADYGRVEIAFYFFEDEDDAYDYFEELHDDYIDDIDDDVFDGDSKDKFKDDMGYIIFDGEVDDFGDFFTYGDYYYGGCYFRGSMVAAIYTTSDKNSAIEDVDEVLEAFGFPKP